MRPHTQRRNGDPVRGRCGSALRPVADRGSGAGEIHQSPGRGNPGARVGSLHDQPSRDGCRLQVGGRRGASIVYVAIASLVGAVALTAGVITLVSASEGMLATLVGATGMLWAISTVRHAFKGEAQRKDATILWPLDRAA
jgi:hypothetical protein